MDIDDLTYMFYFGNKNDTSLKNNSRFQLNQCIKDFADIDKINFKKNARIVIIAHIQELSYERLTQLNLILNVKKNLPYSIIITMQKSDLYENYCFDEYDKETICVSNFKHSEKVEYEFLTKLSFKNLIILAHGEGIHIKLDSTVLCGLSDKTEKNVNGITLMNGCSEESCRRLSNNMKKRILCTDIKSENTYLLSCNSGCVSGELYDSSSSLVKSFLRGYSKKVFGVLDQHFFEKEKVDLCEALIKEDIDMVNIVCFLNQIEYFTKLEVPFVSFQLIPNTLTYQDYISIRLNETICLSEKKIQIFNINTLNRKYLYCYSYDGNDKIVCFAGCYYLIVLKEKKEKGGDFSISLAHNEVDILENNICTSLEDVNQYNYLINSFSNETKESRLIINKIYKYKKKLSDIFQYIVKIRTNKIFDINNFKNIIEHVTVLHKNIIGCIFKLIIINGNMRLIENFYLEKSYVCKKISGSKTCNRCNSCLNIEQLNSLYLTKKYSKEYCPICGLKGIFPIGINIVSSIKVLKNHLLFCISINNYRKCVSNCVCYFEMLDKANNNIVVKKILELSSHSEYTIKFPREIIKGYDLHSYRGVVLVNETIAYYRGRFQN